MKFPELQKLDMEMKIKKIQIYQTPIIMTMKKHH